MFYLINSSTMVKGLFQKKLFTDCVHNRTQCTQIRVFEFRKRHLVESLKVVSLGLYFSFVTSMISHKLALFILPYKLLILIFICPILVSVFFKQLFNLACKIDHWLGANIFSLNYCIIRLTLCY